MNHPMPTSGGPFTWQKQSDSGSGRHRCRIMQTRTTLTLFLFLAAVAGLSTAQSRRGGGGTKKTWMTKLPNGVQIQEYARVYGELPNALEAVRAYSRDEALPAINKHASILYESIDTGHGPKDVLAVRVNVEGRKSQACLVARGFPLKTIADLVDKMNSSQVPITQGTMKKMYVHARPLAQDAGTLENIYPRETRVFKHCDNPAGELGVYRMSLSTSHPVSTETYTISGMIDPSQPLHSVPVQLVLEKGLTFVAP